MTTLKTQKSTGKRTNRRWTHEENVIILEYLSETVKQGYSIEKPNALAYYKKLITETGLTDCTPDLVKNKARNFQTTFVAALAWQKNTGQGIKDTDGVATFEEVLNKRYPYFTLMEEVWGEKSNIIPPFVAESTHDAVEEYFVDENGNVYADRPPEDNLSPHNQTENDDLVAEDSRADETGLRPNARAHSSRGDDSHAEDFQDDDDDPLIAGVQKASNRLLKQLGKKVGTAKSAYEELLIQREESSLQKMKIQEARLDFEKARFEDSFLLERDRFSFEKTKWEAEVELKRKELETKELQINADKEVRLKELEIEALKLSHQRN